jgi:hypothetical protein
VLPGQVARPAPRRAAPYVKTMRQIHRAGVKPAIKAFQPLVELAIKKISTSAEKLLCMVKSYEYRYRAQDKPSQMQRRNRSISCLGKARDA